MVNRTLVAHSPIGEQLLKKSAAAPCLEAQQEIIFSCGDSTLKITPGRIEILSPEDRLNC